MADGKKYRIKKPPKASNREKTFDSVTSDIDEDRLQMRNERHLQVYKQAYKLRDHYYSEYMEVLREKIEKQREEIKIREQENQNKMRIREKKEKDKSMKRRKKMTRVELNTDDNFLKSIEKSEYYKSLYLLDRLKKKKLIRCQEDVEEFWKTAKTAEGYERYKNLLTNKERVKEEPKEVFPPVNYENRPMSDIKESRDTVRRPPSTKSSSSHKYMEPWQIARVKAKELEEEHPPIPLPPLNCYTMELGDKPKPPEQVIREMNMSKRETERKGFVKRLRSMYKLAISNTASTRRLFDRHDGELDDRESLNVKELLDYMTDSQKRVASQKDLEVNDRQIDLEWKRHLAKRIEPVVKEDNLKSASLQVVFEEENEFSEPIEEKEIEIGDELIKVPLSLDSVPNYGGKIIVSITSILYDLNYLLLFALHQINNIYMTLMK
ncbi:DgyrCDS2541 [Dimorphilus gyrociliatus]|uniref:DgyrCDS2541 n=1 Tax=Dimorphilus gyrociliatus TaxID=2664684 RepID=A0A7I8VBX6_9ANNE|nr:DgyrCDS2541 [Dimorphilus gyrociliatus]